MHSRSRARASGASAARFDRPAWQATEPRAKREVMSALCHGMEVDSTFERSENVYTVSCSVRGVVYTIIAKFGAAFICACALY